MNYTNIIFSSLLVCFLMGPKKSESEHMQASTAQITRADLALDASWVMAHSNKGVYVKYAAVTTRSLHEPFNHAPIAAAYYAQLKKQHLFRPLTYTAQSQECNPKKHAQLAPSRNAMTCRFTPGKGTFLSESNGNTPYAFQWVRKQYFWPAKGSGSSWVSCIKKNYWISSVQSAAGSTERWDVALSETKMLKSPGAAVNMQTNLKNLYQIDVDDLKLTSSSLKAVPGIPPDSKILRQKRFYTPESAAGNPHTVFYADKRSVVLYSFSSAWNAV